MLPEKLGSPLGGCWAKRYNQAKDREKEENHIFINTGLQIWNKRSAHVAKEVAIEGSVIERLRANFIVDRLNLINYKSIRERIFFLFMCLVRIISENLYWSLGDAYRCVCVCVCMCVFVCVCVYFPTGTSWTLKRITSVSA